MQNTVYKEINYISECLDLLYHFARKETFEELHKSLSQGYAISDEQFHQTFDLLIRIEQTAKERLKDSMELLGNYFTHDSKHIFSFLPMFIFNPSLDWTTTINNIEDLKAYHQRESKEEYYKRFGDALPQLAQFTDDPISLTEPMEILRYIMQSELSDADKWRIQQIFIEPEKHRELLYPIFSTCFEVIHEYHSEIELHIQHFYNYWSSYTNGNEIIDILRESVGIKIDGMAAGCYICPHFLLPNSLSIYGDGDRIEPFPYYLHIGIIFDKEFTYLLGNGISCYTPERAIKKLKLLSDKSKFDILMHLRDQKSYGKELSSILNLTTATISHHMSALLEESMLTISKEDKRIYYQSNTDEIEELLRYCLDVLCNKKS